MADGNDNQLNNGAGLNRDTHKMASLGETPYEKVRRLTGDPNTFFRQMNDNELKYYYADSQKPYEQRSHLGRNGGGDQWSREQHAAAQREYHRRFGGDAADDTAWDYSAPRDESKLSDHSTPRDLSHSPDNRAMATLGGRGYTPSNYAPAKTQSALNNAEQKATGAGAGSPSALAKGGLTGAEHAGNWQTNVAPQALGKLGKVANVAGPQGKIAARLLNVLSKNKFAAGVMGAGGGIMLILALLMFAAGGNFLGTISQQYQEWMTRLQSGGDSSRSARVMKAMLFGSTDTCLHGAIRCRLERYSNNKTADRLRSAGFDVETGTNTGKIKTMSYTGSDGKKVTVTDKNFNQLARSDPTMRANIERFASTRAGLFRNRYTLSKWKLRGIARDLPKGDGTKKGNATALRNKEYGVDANVKKDLGNTDEPDDVMKDAMDADGDIQKDATQLREETLANGKPADARPNTSQSALASIGDTIAKDPARAASVFGEQVAKGTAKGAVMGVLADIDNYCTIYSISRVVSIGAKVYVGVQLMRYAAMMFSAGDKQTAGDIQQSWSADGTAQPSIDTLQNLAATPSTDPATQGQTFDTSAGYQLMSQGSFNGSWDGLAQYVTGGWLVKLVLGITAFVGLDFAGMSIGSSICHYEQQWWGQGLMMIGGLLSDIPTGFGSALWGAAKGAIAAIILALGIMVITPWLTNIIAGTVAPDIVTDPGAGGAAGDATSAGAAKIAEEIHRTNGKMATTVPNANQDIAWTAEDTKTYVAAQQILNREAGVWNLDNPMSIPNQLAVKLAPLASGGAMQRLSAMFATVAKLPSMLFSAFVPSASATESSVAFYRGDLCQDDDYVAMNLARTASCGLIYMSDPALLDPANTNDDGTGKYDPIPVKEWMFDGKHCVNTVGVPENCVTEEQDPFAKALQENGLMKSMLPQQLQGYTEYELFLLRCAYGNDPVTQDGYGADITQSTSMCSETGNEKLSYFRAYTMDSGYYDAISASDDDKLGYVEPDAYTKFSTSSSTVSVSPDGAGIADAAKQMAQWGGWYLWGGGHGSLDDLKYRIDQKFSGGNIVHETGDADGDGTHPNSNGVDCSGFVRAVVYAATGRDVGSWNQVSSDSSNWKRVSEETAQPGDVFHTSTHTGIIISNDPAAGKYQTAESFTVLTGMGLSEHSYGYATQGVYRYVGSGS